MFTFLVLHDRRPPKYETSPASRFHIWEVFCHKLTIYAKATRLEDGGFRPEKVDTKPKTCDKQGVNHPTRPRIGAGFWIGNHKESKDQYRPAL
jgi:hypothetical protein